MAAITIPVEDLARNDVASASKDTSVPELAQIMREENVGSVAITNDDSPSASSRTATCRNCSRTNRLS